MAKALLQYETISGEEVDMILEGANLDDLEKSRKEHDLKLEEERKESAKKMKKKEQKGERKDADKSSSMDPIGEPITT